MKNVIKFIKSVKSLNSKLLNVNVKLKCTVISFNQTLLSTALRND